MLSELDDSLRVCVKTGESAERIVGIEKLDKFSLQIVMSRYEPTAIYNLGIYVAPMHCYGDRGYFEPENACFGFTKGDLTSIRARSSSPMGAGAYKLFDSDEARVTFEANENYYKGIPKTEYISFCSVASDDMLSAIENGTIDVAGSVFSKEIAANIADKNGGDSDGDVFTVRKVCFPAYGYVGINAATVNVGGDASSEASVAFRKAIAVVLAVCRQKAAYEFFGEGAVILEYPIALSSWAYPENGSKAYSVDVEGKPIFSDEMTAEECIIAAKEAALGFFKAAGFTVENGRLTGVPDGTKLSYEMLASGGANGHPAMPLVREANKIFGDIGFELTVRDVENSDVLWSEINAGRHELWCAAWSAAPDPELSGIYHSQSIASGDGALANNSYNISDSVLDGIIDTAKQSADNETRKILYKAALERILDFAVEIPFYQRFNCVIFSSVRINAESITEDITPFYGWLNNVENIRLKARR